MAKPFYSMEEVCQMLGKNQDQVKELVRAGSLREFRDAGKVFFKAEDVDKLSGAGKKSDTGEITLESVGEELPSIGQPSSGGTSLIGLEPLDDEPAPASPPSAAPRKKEDSGISSAGIGVFDEDEVEIDADPMAKTQITTGQTDDQLTLEGAGSGSGLLDLTREADDTSLGAELLDEIYPGEEEAAPKKPAAAAPPPPTAEEAEEEEAPAETLAAVESGQTLAPVVVAGDPSEGVFGGLMVSALLLLAVSGSVVGAVLQGFLPDYAVMLSNNFLIFLGGALGVLVVCLLIGWLMGRSAGPRRA